MITNLEKQILQNRAKEMIGRLNLINQELNKINLIPKPVSETFDTLNNYLNQSNDLIIAAQIRLDAFGLKDSENFVLTPANK